MPRPWRLPVLLDLGRPGEALAEFDRAIEIDPRDALFHTNRGNALRNLGRVEDALAAHARPSRSNRGEDGAVRQRRAP